MTRETFEKAHALLQSIEAMTGDLNTVRSYRGKVTIKGAFLSNGRQLENQVDFDHMKLPDQRGLVEDIIKKQLEILNKELADLN